jgi:hypothetical protein
MSGSMDVLVTVGEAVPRVVSLALGDPGQVNVTIVFPLDGSTVFLTFGAERFLAFVEQLRAFAATMHGKPS